MRSSELFLLITVPLCGQIILEDFKGCNVTSATPGNPTVVTCSQPHGYDQIQAKDYVILGTVADGNTLTVGSQTWTYKTALSAPNQILIDVDNTHTMINTVDALNTTGAGVGTRYSTGTSACSVCYVLNAAISSGGFWVFAKSGGSAGNSITIAGTGGIENSFSTLRQEIPLYVSGATGAWIGLGSNFLPAAYTSQFGASIGKPVNSTQISIGFDSTGLTWDGQTGIYVRRASYQDQNDLFSVFQDQGWANTESITAQGLKITVPSCTDNTNDALCSQGFQKPENQKNYLCSGGSVSVGAGTTFISTFVVSGSTITITLNGLWSDCNSLFPPMVVGQLVWIRGYFAYSTNTNPNSFAAQTAALAFSSIAGGSQCLPLNTASGLFTPLTIPAAACRGFVVQTKTTVNGGTQTQVTIKNPTDLSGGLVDGSYTGTCADTHCPLFTNAHAYMMTTAWASPYSYVPNDRSGSAYSPGFGVIGYAKYGAYPSAIANPTTVNRYRFYQLDGVTADYSTGVDNFQIGTYTHGKGSEVSSADTHWYHDFAPRLYANQWHLIEATGTPSHCVCEGGNGIWPNNPTVASPYSNFTGSGSPTWTYWYGMNNTYVDGPGYTTATIGNTVTYNQFLIDTVTGEPDEWVPNRTAVWSASRYISGVLTANQGYEATWTTGPLTGVTYQVRYSTSDMKVNGFSTGLCKSGTTTCSGADTVSVDGPTFAAGGYNYLWQSATLAATTTSYIGIRPTMPITWAANTGLAYWVGSDFDPMMSSGDKVTISLNGNTQTNVATTGVMPRQTWFRFVPQDVGTGAWTVPGQLTSIVATGGGGSGESCLATLNGVNHNLVAGWKIMVLGTTNATLGAGGFYGVAAFYTVATTPSATTFTFICPNVPDGTYNADAQTTVHMAIMSYPGVLVAGTSPGYAASGSLTSTEDLKNFSQIVFSPPSISSGGSGGRVSGGPRKRGGPVVRQ